ncbi:MAG: NADH-quinone oxidoreductase subunit J [Chthonomonadetes bacterium]|nr:NADH-quinone oxidoreductase subunit J [Chthonomonadetes bacterium]
MFAQILFVLMAIVIVVTSIGVVAARNPVRSALNLVANFFALAVLYLFLYAQFVAAVQIIVYAGAIMVLFLFTIMLLNLGSPAELADRGEIKRPITWGLALLFVIVLAGGVFARLGEAQPAQDDLGTVQMVGKFLFADWVYPFELTSILLLIAIVGAIVMAKRRL